MKYFVKGLTVVLILGFALAMTACGDDVTRDRIFFEDSFFVSPAADLSFSDLVYYGDGALFQRFNRSIRFFGDGRFRSTAVGLNPGNATAAAVGDRWELVSETRRPQIGWTGRIAIFDGETVAARYWIDFTLIRHILVIDEVVDNADSPGALPTAANLPRGEDFPFNWGRIPVWADDAWAQN